MKGLFWNWNKTTFLVNFFTSYLIFYAIENIVVFDDQNLSWTNVHAEVPQRSILGPSLFLIYINNLLDNLTRKAKLFADDTSLFSIIHEVYTSAKELNDDLKMLMIRLSNGKWSEQRGPGSLFQSQIRDRPTPP